MENPKSNRAIFPMIDALYTNPLRLCVSAVSGMLKRHVASGTWDHVEMARLIYRGDAKAQRIRRDSRGLFMPERRKRIYTRSAARG
jgi:hypothetical protein